MQDLLSNMSLQVNDKIYLKNPQSSDLGKRIVAGSIDIIDEIGFEACTFRKLGNQINSPEASIYRYFENKHKLLLYLTSWYWSWMEYHLVFNLANIESANQRLERAINLLTQQVTEDSNFSHINEVKLNRIVISESSKSYLTKEVDHDNEQGAFKGYKSLVQRVADIILEINPQYQYPHMLLSTVIEGAHHQRYFAEHLPRLTDVIQGQDSITEFYQELVAKAIRE